MRVDSVRGLGVCSILVALALPGCGSDRPGVGEPCTPGECVAGAVCQNGVCAACREGEETCGDVCADVLSNGDHCGACGVSCGAGADLCQVGVCVATCSANLAECQHACVDTLTDPNSTVRTAASWVVDAGIPGARPA